MRPGRLEGRVCIVTGAGSARGIGWTTVTRFAEEGARHIYVLDLDASQFTALRIEAQSKLPATKVTFLQVDACDEAAVQSVCETAVEEEGRLDVFFANAGIVGSPHSITCEEEGFDNFMRVIKNNTGSHFIALKHAPKHMMKTDPTKGKTVGSGSIVITASVTGFRGGLAPAAYCAGKAASASLVQTTAVEHLRKGQKIRVNAVAPGMIKTDLLPDNLTEKEKFAPEYFTEPIAIANAVLYLASDESDFVNGETIVVDNGLISGVRVEKLLK